MTDHKKDEVLNLEDSCQIELNRPTIVESQTDQKLQPAEEELQGPHGSRRCSSEKRELLNSHFPTEA